MVFEALSRGWAGTERDRAVYKRPLSERIQERVSTFGGEKYRDKSSFGKLPLPEKRRIKK